MTSACIGRVEVEIVKFPLLSTCIERDGFIQTGLEVGETT
jgi:hypothetical protein